MLFLGSLAVTRILYEFFFPRLLWLGRPFPALTLATGLSFIIQYVSRRFSRSSVHPLTLSPLLLNLLYLFIPTVDLVQSRFIFAASLWLTAVLLINTQVPSGNWPGTNINLLLAALLPVYLLAMPRTVGRADTFEFQVVAPQLGIAHPTGYPLYLILGKFFTLLPIGSVAWRLNLGTTVFALAALIIVYQLGHRLLNNPVLALLGAVVLGLTPTFWSQAIEAEVYSLHALIVAAALWLMQRIINNEQLITNKDPLIAHYLLFLVIGLGLTNHLTTLFLLPPAALTLILVYRSQLKSLIMDFRSLARLTLAFLAPLALYAYLPIRWATVNGERMGFGRFLDWVVGGRFQGALQWDAWLRDPTRYAIVGRLFLDNWGWINLAVAATGLIYLLAKKRPMALILLVTWLGYTFYNLNYYVPDLAVFLVPAQIVMAVWWMAGVTAVLKIDDWLLKIEEWKASFNLQSLIIGLLIIPILFLAVRNWPQIDRSQDDGLTKWGQGVLKIPLADNAAILADSEKIAPLYYLQQAEGMRPDLEIMVLPDEAAYRAELDSRIAAGQTVYLARFLPGLEGIYHLRSQGPLTEVSTQPLTELPASATPTSLYFNGVQLIGYELEPVAAVDEMSTAVTLYWQANQPTNQQTNQHIYIRWNEETAVANQQPIGQHPANNYYPTLAWDLGEIVPDYHLLPRPITSREQRRNLQVGMSPPFTPAEAINWQTVTTITLLPTGAMKLERPLRAQIGSTFLNGVQYPAQIRPYQAIPVTISGFGYTDSVAINVSVDKTGSGRDQPIKIISLDPGGQPALTFTTEIVTALENGCYYLIASQTDTAALCGWLQPAADGCVLGEIEISGAPLPDGATNYEDKIALLNIDLPQTQLQPGGQFSVNFTWQSLATIAEDYTVFIQVLDAQDKIVGQVDSWPVQGTYPTSQWSPGETINDAYDVQLDDDLPAGQYRLQVGWYLLGNLRRLSILDEAGQAVNDKLLVSGLVVP